MELSERKKKILRAVVESYIQTADVQLPHFQVQRLVDLLCLLQAQPLLLHQLVDATAGTSHILDHPEYQDVGKAQKLMSYLTEDRSLAQALALPALGIKSNRRMVSRLAPSVRAKAG